MEYQYYFQTSQHRPKITGIEAKTANNNGQEDGCSHRHSIKRSEGTAASPRLSDIYSIYSQRPLARQRPPPRPGI